MQQSLNAILDGIWKAWPFRWRGLIAAWLIAIGATVFILVIPDSYEVSSNLAISAGDDDLPLPVADAMDQLVSNDVLSTIVNKVDFGTDAATPAGREKTINEVRSRTVVDHPSKNRLSITYSDSDPTRAWNVSRLLLSAFEHAIGDAGNASRRLGILNQEIDSQMAALSQAEAKVAEYRRLHFEVFGDGGIDARLDSARVAADKAAAEFRAAVARRDHLQQVWRSGTNPVTSDISPQRQGGTDATIERLNTKFIQLQELRSRYSDTYPDVILARRDVDAIMDQYPPGIRMCSGGQRMRPADASDGAAGGAPQSIALDAGPASPMAVTQAAVNVSAANIDVCRTAAEMSALQSELGRLSQIGATAAPVEHEFQTLNAQRDTIQGHLQQLRDRQKDFVGTDGGAVYQVLEPPTLPRAPASPQRGLLLLGALFGALGGGVLVSFLGGAFADRFVRIEELERNLRLPVYGALSQVNGLRQRLDQSTQLVTFSAGLGALLAIMLLFVIVNPYIATARQWLTGTLPAHVQTSEAAP